MPIAGLLEGVTNAVQMMLGMKQRDMDTNTIADEKTKEEEEDARHKLLEHIFTGGF